MLMAESEKHRDSPPVSRLYREFDLRLHKSPISLHQFERLLNQVDNSIKNAYRSSNIAEADRKIIEKDMLTQVEIPQILIEPVKQLLFQTIGSLQDEINEAELYFTDVSGLGLSNDNSSREHNRKHPLDAIQRIPLRRDGKVRRCIRCGSFMDDILPNRSGNPIITTLGRTCLCGSSWMLLDTDEIRQSKVRAMVSE